MQKIIVVDKTEILHGTKGEYLKVTDKGGKTQNIFDRALWNLFGDGLAVELTLEKQGTWWNVTGAVPVGKEVAKELAEKEKVTREEAVRKEPAPKPKYSADPARDSIERSVALKAAVDIMCATISRFEKIIPDEYLAMLKTGALFKLADGCYAWLKGGLRGSTEPDIGQDDDAEGDEGLAPSITEGLIEIAWELVRPKLNELINKKKAGWTNTDAILNRLLEVGADPSIKNVGESYNALSDESKVKFINMMERK